MFVYKLIFWFINAMDQSLVIFWRVNYHMSGLIPPNPKVLNNKSHRKLVSFYRAGSDSPVQAVQ